MKNILYLLLLFTGIVNGQIINFPDANFKAKLLQPSGFFDEYLEQVFVLDANNDGEIEVNEVNFLLSIDISNANISDLTGISNFTSLVSLNCSNNPLQNISIGSANINLKELVCNYTLLQSLSIDPAVTLKRLFAGGNQLSTLSTVDVNYDFTYHWIYEDNVIVSLVSNNITSFTCEENYDYLYLGSNPLTTFDLNGRVITSLDLSFTSLSSITGTGRLKFANFQNCQFTELDLTNVSFYWANGGSEIFLGNNPVDKVIFGASSPANLTYTSTNSSFDLTNFGGYNNCRYHPQEEEGGHVRIIDCPNLNFLSVKNGVNYRNITCTETTSGETWTQSTLRLAITNCPSLSFICVDEGEQEHIQEKINTLGLQNQVQVNTYCSFTPGGDYNTITGNLIYALSGNDCNVNGISNPYIKININDGTNTGSTFASSTGNYAFYTQTGTLTVTPEVENPNYFFIAPANAVLNFPLLDNSNQTQNFCITANGVRPDLEITVTPLGNASPGFDSRYKIIYKNKGNQTQSGTVNLTFDELRTDLVSATPSINGQLVDTLFWNFSNLLPLETRVIDLILNVNSPLEIPAVNSGDILEFIAIINPIENDETPLDNEFTFSQTVVNSYDPNDKTCLEGNTITPEDIGKYVHYNINFENVGTADAVNVVIKDIIDTTMFDMNSLQLLYASHPVETKIDGNKVEFIFKNINLPPSIIDPIGGHGNVLFKIKTLPTLLVGDQIANIANIYFDYNAPIETNEARSTFAALNNSNFVKDHSITVAPNPAKNSVIVTSKNNIKSIQLFDVQGRILQTVLENNKSTTLDISNKTNGVYFLKITTEVGSIVEKIIKD